MKKSAMRRPSTRNSNQRVLCVDVPGTSLNGQQFRGNNMIVTMSMEQNVASAAGAGRIAASRTCKISKTSTVFDTSGIAIEVVCGSTMENHEEVLMDVVSNVHASRRESSSGRTGGNLKRSKELLRKQNANQCDKPLHTADLRAKLSFLHEEQFEYLLRYNVQQPKDMLSLTLLQLISIGIRMDQLERMIATINENLPDLSELVLWQKQQSQTGAEGKTNAKYFPVQRTVDIDDDEDKPLVIDETLPNSRDDQTNSNTSKVDCKRLRSVDDIEKSLAVVRHLKIPKSRAAISEIRTELSHIVADLNANEAQIVQETQGKREVIQRGKAAPTTGITANPEPITSTSKQPKPHSVGVKADIRSIKPAKWAKKATTPTGRTLRTKSATNLPSQPTDSNVKQQTNNESQSAVQPHFVHTGSEGLMAECSQKQGLYAVPTKPTFGVLILNSKDIKASHKLVQSYNAKSVVAPNNLAPKENAVPSVLNSNPECSTQPHAQTASGAAYINPDSTNPQGGLGLPTKTDVDIGEIGGNYINEANTTVTTCESLVLPADFSNDPNLFSTTVDSSNKACTKDHVSLQSNADESQPDKNNTTTSPTKTTITKIQGGTRIATNKNSKSLKSLSAALARGELQLKQPTILLTKLNPYSFPLAALKQGSKVDADSTTATFVEVSTSTINGQEPEKQIENETEQAEEAVMKPQKMVRQKRSSSDANSGQETDKDERQETTQVQSDAGIILQNNSSCHEIESSTRRESLKCAAAFNESQELENKSINAAHPPQKQKQKRTSNRNPKPNSHKKAKKVVVVQQDLGTRCNIPDNGVSVGATMTDKNLIEPDNAEQSITESSNICDSNNGPLQEALCTSYDSLSEGEACNKLKAKDAQIAAKRNKTLDEAPVAIKSSKYDSNDVDMVVAIASPPLSPMSSGIASPTNLKAKLNDYTPAVEIDGHLSYPPMLYILYEVDRTNVEVNKPAGLDALLCSSTADPRLEKYNKKAEIDVLKLSPSCVSDSSIQHDPRRHNSVYHNEPYTTQLQQPTPQQTPNMLLYGCLHRSPWYQSLMSTMKIQINQAISVLVRAINNFQKIRLQMPYAVFDIFKLYCAGELLEILDNLGLFVDVNGVISQRKSSTSLDTHSYGGSTLVNTTYSFIQPMMSTPSNTPPTRSNTPHTPTPFVSCYIESPPVPVNTPPPSAQRRHCGLKAPYIPRASSKSPAAPVARELRYEECWDLEERVPPQANTNNNAYSHHRTSHVYPRGERSREHRVGRTFGYRKRY